jgi:hypothetical protein
MDFGGPEINSSAQSPWEANFISVNKLFSLTWKQKILYAIHKRLQTSRFWATWIHYVWSQSTYSRSTLIFTTIEVYVSEVISFFMFSIQDFVRFSGSFMPVSWIAHLITCSYLSTAIIFGEDTNCNSPVNCVCGLVVRIPGFISRGPGFNSGRYQIEK